jgi:glucose-1-phosphate adenylyltransferase
LSNLINSGFYSICVLVQFKSQSLLRHLRDGWQFGGLLKDQFIIPVSAPMRSADEIWYRGTADAIFQNIDLIDDVDEHFVAIFAADHIYRMNVREMLAFHERMHADVSVAAISVSAHLAAEFGVIEAAADGSILGFHEKKPEAPTIPSELLRIQGRKSVCPAPWQRAPDQNIPSGRRFCRPQPVGRPHNPGDIYGP